MCRLCSNHGKFPMRAGHLHVLIRRLTGLGASDDTWDPLENFAKCDAIRGFEHTCHLDRVWIYSAPRLRAKPCGS